MVENMGKRKPLNLNVEIQCEIRDKNGKLLKIHRQVSESLVKNFALALRGLMYGNCDNKSVTIKGTNGSSWTYPNLSQVPAPILSVNAGAGVGAHGIQVGSGDTPVDRDDYVLETQYTHGIAAGQLSHGAMTVEAVNGTPPDSQFRLIRVFTNDYTETQTVKEIGLAFYHVRLDIPISVYALIARDVLTTPQDIPSSGTLTVRYIFKVTA